MSKLIRTDFHVHTNHSPCGHPEAAPSAVVEAAREAGLEAIGISDHLVSPADFDRPRLVREELPENVEGLRIYVGGEAEMHGRDRPSIPREFAAGLDFVVFAASHLHSIGPHVLYDLDVAETAALLLDLKWGVIETGYADILAHPFHVPTSRFSFARVVRAVEPGALRELGEAAAEAGIAIECNPRFVRGYPEEAAWLFQRFLEAGCKLAVNSDAHHPKHVGCRGRQFAGERELQAIGVTEGCLWRYEDRATKSLKAASA